MKALLRLLIAFRPYTGQMILGILLALVTVLANIGLLTLSSWFIASMAVAGASGVLMNYMLPSVGVRLFALTRTGGRYLERLVTHDATFRLLSRLKRWLYDRLEPLAPARLQDLHSGDLMSRMQSDIDSLENFYTRGLVPLVVGVLGVLGVSGFLALFSLRLALTSFSALLAVGLVLPALTGARAAKPGREAVNRGAELHTHTVDALQGMSELRVAGADEEQAEAVLRAARGREEAEARRNRIAAASEGIQTAVIGAAVVAAVLLVVPLVRAGTLPGPYLAMLTVCVLASFETVTPLPQAIQQLGTTTAAAERVFGLADQEPAVTRPEAPAPIPEATDLRLSEVTLRYPGANAPALERASLELPADCWSAVVGPTGSGKSSLVNLLARFFPYEEGTARFGGTEISRLDPEALREQLAVLPQHPHLFHDTIAANLRMAAPEATEAELEEACRHAGIWDFVESLSSGLDTVVGETGLRLSAGEGKRIALARTLLQDRRVYLLDEPTEHLDPDAEEAVLRGLRTRLSGRTVVLITHRMAGLSEMEHIVVMDRGRVAEAGSYPELLERDGALRQLLDLIES
jgi:ATP-binding cassette subfamily C protein CydC